MTAISPRARSLVEAAVFVLLAWRALPPLLGPGAALLLPPLHGPPPPHRIVARVLLATDITTIASALAAAAILLALRGVPVRIATVLAWSNLPRTTAASRQVVVGAALGCGAMLAVVGGIAAAGDARLTLSAAPASAIARTLGVFALAFALVGLAEELVNRGFVQRVLTEGLSFWPATIITSIFFALLHLSEGDPWFGAGSTGLRAVFFCLTLRLTGSLGFAIGFHAAWDFTESALLGFPDSSYTVAASLLRGHGDGPIWASGGPVGPEGSVFAYAVTLALIAAALLLGRGRTAAAPITAPPRPAAAPPPPPAVARDSSSAPR